jgi:hypothetical protein
MSWCEVNRVDFLFGLARNPRLVGEIGRELTQAEAEARRTGKPARRFKDFSYSTLESWSRRRRVVGKAEWTNGEANPRFVVTTLKPIERAPRELYEDIYCARGDMENRIKESQADLFADRTSTATMLANQLRLWFSSFAYILVCAVRRVGLGHTQFADATAGTIRLKLFKIGALVKVSARRIKFALPTACPMPTNGDWPPPTSPAPLLSDASPRRAQNAASQPQAHRRPETTRNRQRKRSNGHARLYSYNM